MAFWNKQDPENKKKKSVGREWLDAALFAIVAATIIRLFLFEAYTIPTGSMEGSLLVNDYLFVSKLAYGPRIPMTPLAVPLVHNAMPITGGKSYSEAVQWKYHRWPGFGNIERYDVVVFNYPGGDTVMAERPGDDYYSALRAEFGNNREEMKSRYTIITRPIDKKENYIKRCVGLPGDKIEVKDAVLYVNDQPAAKYPHQKLLHRIQTKEFGLSDEFLEENSIDIGGSEMGGTVYNLANDQVEMVRKLPNVLSVKPDVYPKGYTEHGATFPQDTNNFKFNRDNFGPIIIPKAGVTVTLTPENIALYRRVIINYEGNTLLEQNGKFIINGKECSNYTFKMDYYWMMGDNRDNSLDSRYWGYVPIDHVVGKAWFVWLSYGKGGMLRDMHWKRLFRGIHSLEQ
jgi:signal peptidase I